MYFKNASLVLKFSIGLFVFSINIVDVGVCVGVIIRVRIVARVGVGIRVGVRVGVGRAKLAHGALPVWRWWGTVRHAATGNSVPAPFGVAVPSRAPCGKPVR